MRVLVIGGSGFVGSAIVEKLSQDPGNDVHVLDRQHMHRPTQETVTRHFGDVTQGQWGETRSLEWDFVVNMAGILGTAEMFDNLSSITQNIQSVLNVFENIETGTILYPLMPEVWVNPYTISKISARYIHEMYARHLDRKSIMVRLFNVYGPRQKWEPVRKAVPQFIVRALRDEPIMINGSGDQTMDITHSDDVARAFVALMESPPEENYTVVEVGTCEETTVNQCAKDIIACVGSKSELVNIPMRKGEDEHTSIKCSDAYPIDGGYAMWPKRLDVVVDWYREFIRES